VVVLVLVQEELRIVMHVILQDCVQLVLLIFIRLVAYAPLVLEKLLQYL